MVEYHVAWADRIGLSERWRRDMDLCSETYGTKYYPARVEALRLDIINIRNGPKLKDMINDFVSKELSVWKQKSYDSWKEKNPHQARITSNVVRAETEINYEGCKKLHAYIVQLLEDQGFGTYKTRVETDEVSLNGKDSIYNNDTMNVDNDDDIVDNMIEP